MKLRTFAPVKGKLMTLREVSREFGPSYSSVRDLVLEGTLPSLKLGNNSRIWVRRADVERLMLGEVAVSDTAIEMGQQALLRELIDEVRKLRKDLDVPMANEDCAYCWPKKSAVVPK